MRAVLKHPSKVDRGQVLKSSKGKIYEEIPVPYLLTYTPHRMKVVAKHIFSITKKSGDQPYGCTKADAIWLIKDWGYMIKNNREKQLKSWVRQVRLLLNKCFKTMTIVVHSGASIQDQKNMKRHIMTKTMNSATKKNQMYNLLEETLLPFQKDKVLKESLHMFDTKKDSIENEIPYVAPKTIQWRISWA